MAVQCVFHHTFFNTIPTQQQDAGRFSFSPRTSLSPSASSLQSPSQLGHTNSHIEDELEDKDCHKQTTQEKEQETQQNNFLVKSQNN